MHLASTRQAKAEDAMDDDMPCTSGRKFTEATSSDLKVSIPVLVLLKFLLC